MKKSYLFLLVVILLLHAPTMWAIAPAVAAKVTAEQINEKMGISLFGASSLWKENAKEVATRLRWPMESQTTYSSSFRFYPKPPLEIFGCKTYSLVLHAEEGVPVSISLVFANKGDAVETIPKGATNVTAVQRQEEVKSIRDFKQFIQKDNREIVKILTELLGEPKAERTGASAQTWEKAKRWDWDGATFLLVAPRDEYLSLRMIPTDSLDNTGVERVSRKDLKAELDRRIERRANGDVILKDIPMVDQGPKGFCVPATWERELRYMGIPADMYVLAMAASTGVGGGTSTTAISEAAKQLVQRYGRRINVQKGKITIQIVASAINQGVPLMWTMYSMPELMRRITKRIDDRANVQDWKEWRKTLQTKRRTEPPIPMNDKLLHGHVCMIIGYNKETGEIAMSNSWGPRYAEQWLTVEEADLVSQGELMTILP